MTSTISSTTRAKAPQRRRGEGQWALGYREPLNPSEQLKKDDNPLNVRRRIIHVYAHRGFRSIDPSDLRGRFRWWGLYTQRRPGLDGGKTATLEPWELEDDYFMMRVRTDGALLGADQLRALGEVSTRYARESADITDRQNIQYHWVRIEDVPAIWDRLESAGLTTQEACGDGPRPFLGSPVAGVAADEIIDGTPALQEIKAPVPRQSGLREPPPQVQDVADRPPEPRHGSGGQRHLVRGNGAPRARPRLRPLGRGGLSTNPMLAKKLGVWIPLDEVPDAWEAVVSVFRDYGYRRLRSRARLKFLVADWGVERFREVLETEYLQRRLVDNASPEPPTATADHVGVHRQKDGDYYVGVAPVVGRISGTQLSALADLVERHGADGVRLTAQQKLVVLGVGSDQVDALVDDLDEIGLSARPSSWRRTTMSCTGIEFCKLAIVETKNRAAALVTELERRFPELDTPISVNVNGCPNACARTQVADIGLKGQLVLDDDGNQVEGFQVHLGGGLALGAGFGRKLRAHKVTSAALDDFVTDVVESYLAERVDGESFASWVARADDVVLRGEARRGAEEAAS